MGFGSKAFSLQGLRFVFSVQFLGVLALLLLSQSTFAHERIKIPASEKAKIAKPLSEIIEIQCERLLRRARQYLNPPDEAKLIGGDQEFIKRGFSEMDHARFSLYNAPQVWVESRQLPKALDGRAPLEGAFLLDLGAGIGDSAKIVSHFANPSWHIHGVDFNPEFIAIALKRRERLDFVNQRGESISTSFSVQDVSEPLLGIDGQPIPSDSVDFAYSSGVVGLYLNSASVTKLAKNLMRVLKPDAYAALDAGPAISVRQLKKIMQAAGFVYEARVGSVWFEPRPKLIFKKPELLKVSP
jgi:SAM-dependent methyltransferase